MNKLVMFPIMFFLMFLITAAILEVAGLFIYKNHYNWNHRYQFATKNSWRVIEDGLWTYRPDADIRTAGVYGFPFGRPWVEYNCRFQTSRFGLIKAHPDELDSYDLLVLGDSFTEGQGGCPWLTAESTRGLGLSVLNGGLQGAGITAFANLERYLTSHIEIRDVLIIAISNDFFRAPNFDWIEKGAPCLVDGDCDETNSWWGTDSDFSTSQLQRIGQTRIDQRYQAASTLSKLGSSLEYLAWYSMTARVILTYANLALDLLHPPEEEAESDSQFEKNMASLRSLRAKYPRLRLMLVTQRDELGLLGGKNDMTLAVEAKLEESGIGYESCRLQPADYMYIDGHPNEAGYKKLWQCAFGAEHLRASAP